MLGFEIAVDYRVGGFRHLGGIARAFATAAIVAGGVVLSGCGQSNTDADLAAEADLPTEVGAPVDVAPVEVLAGGPTVPTPAIVPVEPDVDLAEMDTTSWVVPLPFYAAGDEPFWRLDIEDGWFIFTRAGLPEIEAPVLPPIKDGAVDVFDAAPLRVDITPGACRSEAGGTGAAVAAVQFDGGTFDGCAFKGESALGGAAEANAVRQAITSIDTCLGRLGMPALVTGIYERGAGQTALGLRTRDGRVFECATAQGGNTIAFLDPVEAGAAGAWMTSSMRFVRGAAAGADCAEAVEVGASGQVLGRLLSPQCRF